MESGARISVLHFSNEVVRGGAEEHMLMLLQSLDRKLFRPRLACPPELLDKLGPDLPADVETTPVSFMTPNQAGRALRFAAKLREWRVDVVHSHMFHASLVASPVAWLCRVPVIIETPHVREHWRKGIKASYFVDRLVGKCVDRFIAVSQANARYLVQEKRLPHGKVTAIANGSDLCRFSPEHQAPPGLRQSLGFGEADPVIIITARLEPQKGHRVLLLAMRTVLQSVPNVRLVCVGEGTLRADLAQQAADLGLGAAVRFAGYQSNIPDWLALADFTVLPSFFEGLPLAAIESMAAGKTVVATDVDGTSEVVVNGETGVTVSPGDPTGLAHAMLRLLRDTNLRETLGRNAVEWVHRHFARERQVRETEELYLREWDRAGLQSNRPARSNRTISKPSFKGGSID